MNASEYDQIARACERLLSRADRDLELVAHPWLHVIYPHPAVVQRYEDAARALRARERSAGRSRSTIRLAREIAAYCRVIARSAAAAAGGRPLSPKALADELGGSPEVILLSWLINKDHLAWDRDFYLEGLQHELADRGLSSLLLLRNQTSADTGTLIPVAKRDGVRARRLLPDTLTPAAEVALWRRISRARSRLRATAIATADPVDRIVAREAYRRMAPALVAPGLRLHAQLHELVRRSRPLMFVTLYEGHAWERCSWHAVQAADADVLRVAYQFTIVFQRAYALRQSLGPAFDPDVLLASGDIPREILSNTAALSHIPAFTFGSYRRPATLAERPNGSGAVLVLPDGLESETTLLFEFALACARALPDIRFRLRTHPLVPFARVRPTLRGLEALRNVEISEGRAIEADLADSGVILYRGSSAVFAGVLAGLKPFHLVRPGEVGLDVLEGLAAWREQIASPDQFASAYGAYLGTPGPARQHEWRVARSYCDGYLRPVEPRVLDQLIHIAKSKRVGSVR